MYARSIGAAVAIAAIAVAGSAMARDQIKIVGSSTVFPFSTAVAEAFAKSTGQPTPVVESTGSGGGLKLFCSGVGTDTPDITNSSRRMKAKEFKQCQDNGVTDIVEAVVGFDGIVVANSKDAPDFALSRAILFKALAKGQGEPTMWNEIDPSLPAARIEVLGPPPSSGTRDAFEELAMQEGCKEAGLSKDECKKVEIRDDGAWVDAGENDNLIVSKLEANPQRARRLRVLVPRSERRQDQGRDRGRRGARVRTDRRGRLPGFALALLLREDGPCRRRPGHHGLRCRVRVRRSLGL